MAELLPFRGWYYNEDECGALATQLTCPPYDVISTSDRSSFVAMSPYNAIEIEVPDPTLGETKYVHAHEVLEAWQRDGILERDGTDSLYVYRMGFTDELGLQRQTTGVLGVIALDQSDQLLPHEQTTAKDVSDRLSLLRATRTNISPVWALCAVDGFAAACQTSDPPLVRATSVDGVHHRLWRVTQQGVLDTIREAIRKQPLLIADGHHRTHVALEYAREQGAKPGSNEYGVLGFVSELSEEELYVQAIHRIAEGVNIDTICNRASSLGDVSKFDSLDSALAALQAREGLVISDGVETLLWKPSAELDSTLPLQIDSLRCEALTAGTDTSVRYQHGVKLALDATHETSIAVLLRPVSVDQIAATATNGVRMPPKSTFFYPKLQTGMVFRTLD